ncbi:MAG TPA: hypothetical protein P5016_20825, partial [Verrucomicrobiales bacterium]|nr:hypothetical protein [Verrucomicrobiales bacterium]
MNQGRVIRLLIIGLPLGLAAMLAASVFLTHGRKIFGWGDAQIEMTENQFENNGSADVDAVFIEENAKLSLTNNEFLNNPRIAVTVSGQATAALTGNKFEGNGND